ncbi:MAG: hypothetical protein GY719_26370 [bacterium]|nr:hypothetical protein [bacterium]
MASRSFHALFLRARDQFAGSSRWLYLAVLALAVVHVTIVTPFVEGSRLELETVSERSRLAAVERGLAEVRPALDAVRKEATSTLTPILDRLIEDLEADFDRLEATHRQIVAAAGEPGEEDETVGEPAPGAAPFVLHDADRVADLRDAETRQQLLAAFAPLVEELISGPRFFDVEGAWKDGVRPRLEGRLDQASSALPRLRGRFPEAEAQWDALTSSLAGVGRAALDVRFEAPSEPFWWTAGSPGQQIELGLTEATRDRIRRPTALIKLRTAVDESFERQGRVAERLTQAKRELAELPAAGTLSGLDLEALVAMFPLLLGMALGGGAVWRSQRLRELGFTTRMAVEHGGPAGLRRWFWSQIQWRTAAGESAASAWHWCVLQTLLGYLLAMTWIALAAVQLRRLETFDRQRLMIFAIAGAAIVLFAVVHRLVVARGAIIGLERAAGLVETEVAAEPEDEIYEVPIPTGGEAEAVDVAQGDGEDPDFLDVQTLRR